MDPISLSSVANIGGGLLSSLGQIFTNKQQIDLAHQQMQWNEKMMDKQNQQQLDFWNKQNEYNDPSAQAERMRDAGLYAGGVSNYPAQSLNSSSANSYQNPNMQNPLQGLGQSVQQSPLVSAQIRNINADTEKKEAESAKTKVEIDWLPIVNANSIKIANREIDLKESLTDSQIKDYQSQMDNRLSQMQAKWNELELENSKLDLSKNAFEAEQFWKGVYLELDKIRLSYTDRQLAIAYIEAMTNSTAVQYQHLDRQETNALNREYNTALVNLKSQGIQIERETLDLRAKEFSNSNNRSWINTGFNLAETLAGTALLFVPGMQLPGAILLGHGAVTTATTKRE